MYRALRYIEVLMPHISRQFLKGEAERKLIDTMISTLSIQGSPARRKKLAKELLTGVERLMLAKRLAIICMLGEGVPFEEISKTLKVSSSTVARLWEQMQKGKFKGTIETVHKNKLSTKILNLAEVFLIPRPRHAPRWKFIDDL